MSAPLRFGLLLFPDVTQLDLTGPAEVFGSVPGAELHLLWKTLDPVNTAHGWKILPTTRFEDCPALDVICVPGGAGQIALMSDEETLVFLRKVGATARYVTSVCTGSLVLAAAGLLDGYRAASHWMSREQLALFGAIPVASRVVVDGNRVTGGGVTAGIDFGLQLVATLCGEALAREIQLAIEYDPHPPFDAGTPERAGPATEAAVRQAAEARQTLRWNVSRKAAARR